MNIDINHIGDREVTKFAHHASAAFAAVLIMAATIVPVVHVPAANANVAIAAPALLA